MMSFISKLQKDFPKYTFQARTVIHPETNTAFKQIAINHHWTHCGYDIEKQLEMVIKFGPTYNEILYKRLKGVVEDFINQHSVVTNNG